MRVTLLRHCESHFNRDPTSTEPGLTFAGIQHATTLRGEYDVVLCSTLTRAVQTFVYSHITAPRILFTDRLREWRRDSCDYWPGEPRILESEAQLLRRISSCLEWIHSFRGSVLVVGHGDFFFHLTATRVEGELFGQHLAIGEVYEEDLPTPPEFHKQTDALPWLIQQAKRTVAIRRYLSEYESLSPTAKETSREEHAALWYDLFDDTPLAEDPVPRKTPDPRGAIHWV